MKLTATIILNRNLPIETNNLVEHLHKFDKDLTNIPILMITALNSQEDKIKAFESGANDYLSKPFDMQELTLRVKSFAQMRHLYIQNQKARIDPLYNLPNIQALREAVEKSLNPTLLNTFVI